MRRGRYRGEDDWWSNSSDGYDDLRITKEIERRRSRSRAGGGGRRRESPPANNIFLDNRLYVPGDYPERERERSRSRHRESSGDGKIHEEDLGLGLQRLLLERNRRDRSDSREHERLQLTYDPRFGRGGLDDDRQRRYELDELKREDERRRAEIQRQIDDSERADKRKKEELQRQLEDAQRATKAERERLLKELEEERRKEEEREEAALREAAEKARKEKEKKDKLAAELKAEEEKKKKEQKELEERILLEADFKKKEAEKKAKEDRERILAEIKAEEDKEKKKKEEEDAAFKKRIREQAIKNGLDPDEMLYNLEEHKSKEKSPRHHGSSHEMVTYNGARLYKRGSKVYRDHILPETLDYYRVRWDYSTSDANILIIDEEIDEDFLYELQEHSKKIIKSRKLIAPGFKKETITTLTPNGSAESIRKKNGKYYMVRKRSVSRSRLF